MHRRITLNTTIVTETTANSLRAERDLIVKELKSIPVEKYAYGFNTLLGPLDKVQIQNIDFNEPSQRDMQLLQGHILGEGSDLQLNWDVLNETIHQTKITQLSQGGTGIHPDTFKKLANANPANVKSFDLELSYGAGDVAVAAEWVSKILPPKTELYPGDAIALISGNFISVGLGSYLHQEFPWDALDLVKPAESSRSSWDNPPQFPISIRDFSTIQEAQESVQRNVETILKELKNRQSGNPLFTNTNPPQARSNNSYMSLNFSLAVTAWLEYSKMLASYLQRVIAFTAAKTNAQDVSHNFQLIQIPKVSQALVNKIMTQQPASHYTAVRGVEDLSDNTIINLLKIHESVKILRKLLNFHNKLVEM